MQYDSNFLIEADERVISNDVFSQITKEPQASHCHQQPDGQV